MKSRYTAFLLTLVPVLAFISIERSIHDDTVLAHGGNKKVTKHKKSQNKIIKKPDMKNNEKVEQVKQIEPLASTTGIILGDETSKNEMVLFSSLSCAACKTLHEKILPEILYELKKEGVTLKIRLELFVDSAPVLAAVKMINIERLEQWEKQQIVEAYFKSQQTIASLEEKAKLPYVRNLVKDILGKTRENDVEKASKQKGLADRRIAATMKKISLNYFKETDSLPAINLNGKVYKGPPGSLDDIKKFIRSNVY